VTERRESAASAEEGERLESAEAGAAEATPTAPSTRWVRIEGLASSGEGVGRLPEGRVVFVEGGVPGDRVETVDWVEGKRMARARIGRLLEASPDRVEPRCAHFGVCGGCTWQQIDYPAQCAAKAQIVQDALERIGARGIANPLAFANRLHQPRLAKPMKVVRHRGSRELQRLLNFTGRHCVRISRKQQPDYFQPCWLPECGKHRRQGFRRIGLLILCFHNSSLFELKSDVKSL